MDIEQPTAVEAATSTVQEPSKAKKPSLTRILPNERLAFDRQIAALRAYAAVYESNGGKPVQNQAAGEVAKMAAATIVMTNAWFTDAGFITRGDGGGFTVAPEVLAFLNAEHGIAPEAAPEKLRPIMERHWATQLLVPRLRVGTMEYDMVRKIVGEACSAQPDHIPRLDLLLEYICFTGLFKKEGNLIRLNTQSRLDSASVIASALPVEPQRPITEDEAGLETYSLTLDPSKKRRIIVKAPPAVSASELKRIQQWLSFQLLVTDGEN